MQPTGAAQRCSPQVQPTGATHRCSPQRTQPGSASMAPSKASQPPYCVFKSSTGRMLCSNWLGPEQERQAPSLFNRWGPEAWLRVCICNLSSLLRVLSTSVMFLLDAQNLINLQRHTRVLQYQRQWFISFCYPSASKTKSPSKYAP